MTESRRGRTVDEISDSFQNAVPERVSKIARTPNIVGSDGIQCPGCRESSYAYSTGVSGPRSDFDGGNSKGLPPPGTSNFQFRHGTSKYRRLPEKEFVILLRSVAGRFGTGKVRFVDARFGSRFTVNEKTRARVRCYWIRELE